jgi:hypothetical protein
MRIGRGKGIPLAFTPKLLYNSPADKKLVHQSDY